jgi:hypothetical protein
MVCSSLKNLCYCDIKGEKLGDIKSMSLHIVVAGNVVGVMIAMFLVQGCATRRRYTLASLIVL